MSTEPTPTRVQSITPETHDEIMRDCVTLNGKFWVDSDFARKLERERDEAKRELELQTTRVIEREERLVQMEAAWKHEVSQLRAELAEARRERDCAQETLEAELQAGAGNEATIAELRAELVAAKAQISAQSESMLEQMEIIAEMQGRALEAEAQVTALRAELAGIARELGRCASPGTAAGAKRIVDSYLQALGDYNKKDMPLGFDSWEAYHNHQIKRDQELVSLRNELAEAKQDTELIWQTGSPVIPTGCRETFWCSVISETGKIHHRHLAYLNGYVMPLCDSQDEPGDDAVAVGDDGDYAWYGWYEESCNNCETQWKFNGEIKAWMKMPRLDAARKNGGAT